MTRAQFDRFLPFEQSTDDAAIVINTSTGGQLHAGILSRNHEPIHLGWEDRLYVGWTGEMLWATPDVDAEKLTIVAGYCRRIWRKYRREPKMPYSIRFGGSRFAFDGTLQLAIGSHGLTCATFILAVFLSAGIQLIDEDSWPVRTSDDRKFLARLKPHASKEHYVRMQAEIDSDCKRICPDEVLGACACELPASFDDARREADGVLEKLGSRTP